jgi:hypothetical protein
MWRKPMLKLSGSHVMLAIIAAGAVVGVVYEPTHVVPLLVWALLVAALWAGIEQIIARKG